MGKFLHYHSNPEFLSFMKSRFANGLKRFRLSDKRYFKCEKTIYLQKIMVSSNSDGPFAT